MCGHSRTGGGLLGGGKDHEAAQQGGLHDGQARREGAAERGDGHCLWRDQPPRASGAPN
jgi:hypothetical protein